MDRATWETAREILESTEVPAAIDERGELWLAILRAQWRSRLERPLSHSANETTAATFTGAGVHRSVLAILDAEGVSDGPELRVSSPDRATLRARSQQALNDFVGVLEAEAIRVAETIGGRHRELLPASVLVAEAAEFHVDAEGIRKVLEMLAEE